MKHTTFALAALLGGTILGGTMLATGALAQEKTLKIGAISDLSGLYADVSGVGARLAAEMAVEDSGMAAKGWKIDVINADHQNKADIAASLARQFYDVDKVDVVVDGVNSAAGLAISAVAKEKNKAFIDSGAASSDLTGVACNIDTIHWVYDTYMLANGTGKAIVKTGGDTWFFLSADYAFGAALERDTTAVINANGGKVLGGVKHPLNSSDFSSFLLQAQASKAKIVGLANAGGDTTNSVKQAAEFGIVAGGQKLAALLMFITDVNSLGLPVAQGLELTSSFYWDLNDGTRAFSERFSKRMKNAAKPTMVQAGIYSSVVHFLKTAEALNGDVKDGAKVVAKMKEMPTDDALFGKGMVRADGRKIHPAYLFEVKKPSESKYAWDYYTLKATIPAEEAFRPLSESACPLVKK